MSSTTVSPGIITSSSKNINNKATLFTNSLVQSLNIDVSTASQSLEGFALRTPIRRLKWLEDQIGVPVYVKLEHQQHTGSFKYRGAMYALFNHPKNIPVIAASAGNHGLAVAYVCQQLGIPVNICLPANASRLKRQRILELGSGLIEFGSSLDEAIVHAQQLASKNMWRFISPYNDVALITASGTIAQEFIQDVPDLKYLIVPVGGGGLISGMAIGAKEINPDICVLGCEPENYPSMTNSLENMSEVSVPHMPTYADGLAVNLEKGSYTLQLVSQLVDDIVTLSEEDLAFGTFSLLNKESMLVEPAGSAGIAALLKYHKKMKFTGPIGIPLCGSNIQKNILNRILGQDFTDPDHVTILDLKGQKLETTPIIRSFSQSNNIVKNDSIDEGFLDIFKQQCVNVKADIEALFKDIDGYVAFCEIKNLPMDTHVISSIVEYLKEINTQTTGLYKRICENGIDYKQHVNLLEIKIRWALQGISHARNAIEWRAAAYDQSNASQFFGLNTQDNPGVNYDRYASSEVKRIEDQLSDIFSIPLDTHGITLVSSGMSAYSLIESFLIRYVLTPSSAILTTPYIYFEAKELLLGLSMYKVITTNNFSAESLLEQLEMNSEIDVIFADPLANLVEQPMTDLYRLIEGISNLKYPRSKPIKLVIDGTMLSGGMVQNLIQGSKNLDVIYYESCSKYLQIGLESCLAGVVVYPLKYQAHFERLRRNSGTILYTQQAFAYPKFTKSSFIQRMRRISDNALFVAQSLFDAGLGGKVRIYHPMLANHADYAIAKDLPFSSGCVNFAFMDIGKNNNNYLELYITKTLRKARALGLPLVKGVSFGYSIPRISAASSLAESEYPFLRLYVGDPDRNSLEQLVHVVQQTFNELI